MKALPIGQSDFKRVIEEDCYYVDKSAVIEELLSLQKVGIVLFPRPRRFGKSLFMSMLDNFFNIDKKEENKSLFDGLYISKSEYYSELSKYPTIFLNLKDLKQESYESTFNMLKSRIADLYRQKAYVKDILDDKEKKIFNLIVGRESELFDLKDSIRFLSKWLEKYHKEKVIILIDEYDAAINESYIRGYYEELMNLIGSLLSSALKDNTSLKLGVLTGVLRVGGASLFSSFNNLKIYDVMSENYNEYFGFTESETDELLEYYGLDLTDEVKDYYDGYNFSGLHIYNPWSILNYASDKKLEPYWISTGSNKLIKELLSKIDNKEEIERLLTGESIPFKYDKSITYESFTNPEDLNNLLNLLLVSGYVTYDKSEENAFGKKNFFKIPNKEVREDLVRIVSNISYKENLFSFNKYENFMMAFLNNEKEYIEKFINEILPNMSYYDTYETFYHGYSLGLFSILLANNNFIVRSNREAGSGRYDVMIKKTDRSVGVIVEFKVCEEEELMEEKVVEAVSQMKEKEYYKELELEGVEKINEIVIVFSKKTCIVR
jgi:hypothetical protein